MKKLLFISCLFLTVAAKAQKNLDKLIISETDPAVSLAPLYFLASDELKGRSTLRPEIDIAAKYVAEEFRAAGLKEVQGTSNYFQNFEFKIKKTPEAGKFQVGSKTYTLPESLVLFSGNDIDLVGEVIYLGYGSITELKTKDVKGKIVVTELGSPDAKGLEAFALVGEKLNVLKENGALALVERFRNYGFPFEGLRQYTMQEHAAYFEAESSGFPVFFVNDTDSSLVASIKDQGLSGSLTVSGAGERVQQGKNVLGWVEGTDPKLKQEYLVLSAHYDHIGLDAHPQVVEGKLDSIFNGARDNAIGTVAVLDAARFFVRHPAKRSILFLAFTGEELGLVGSKAFVASSPIPLNRLVYNLNIDNASYNDTTIISVIGLGRTNMDDQIRKGCAAFGLTAMPDPAPEQNLFDRSDNVSFAAAGVPAPTFSLGIRKFDDEIEKRYHNVSDEVGNFNLNYAMKYIRSYLFSATLIANDPTHPKWEKGDKYESAWSKLYGM